MINFALSRPSEPLHIHGSKLLDFPRVLACVCLLLTFTSLRAEERRSGAVTIDGDHFVRAGRPYQIISGTIHYARVPRAYWRDRLQKARAMGLNTVETYVFWNLHEPRPGEFDFSGQLDVAEFVREAQQEGLNVILRPGPYVCAEWDAGGLPAWLFADPAVQVRTRDPRFLAAADRYLARVGKELSGLQAAHGGPIIAVQIENEYGSFGSDKEYMEDIRQSLVRAGFGNSLLFTSDGVDLMQKDALPEALAVINFGPGEAKGDFAKLAKIRPAQPRMAGEYWDGWFDAWGNKEHVHTDSAAQATEVEWMLRQGISFNLYMFEGGTSFGFMNGANLQDDPGAHYSPQTTSYDYDAPLDEAGRPRKKFYLLRDVIQRVTGTTPPALPRALPMNAVTDFELKEGSSLWANLPAPIASKEPKSMEDVGQAYGYILYRTHLDAAADGDLKIEHLQDYAGVYVNRKLAGTLDRRLGQSELHISAPAGATLDLLVENTGRVNYGPHLPDGRSGIAGSIRLGDRELTGWEIYLLPMDNPQFIQQWSGEPTAGPAFYRGYFSVDQVADTFLDTSRLGKGFVWVNGHNLGRVWKIGPQHSLFVPGPWLRKGRNEVVVFDYEDLKRPTLRGVTEPIWSSASK